MSAPPEKGPFAAPPLVYVVQPPGVEYRVLREEDLEDRRMPEAAAGDDRPIAYMYRPIGYEMVPPERLDEWEQMMTERVGLNPPPRDPSGAHAEMRAIRSVSFCCESLYCGCDCDEV
jgi:hypothetical protein